MNIALKAVRSLFGAYGDWFRSFKKNAVLGPFLSLSNPLALTGGQIGDLSAQQAQTMSSVYNAVRVYQTTISTLGLNLYQGTTTLSQGIASDHYLQLLVGSCQWNDEQTDTSVLDYFINCLFMRGNLYGHIIRRNNGKPSQIVPIDPDFVWPVRKNGKIFYKISAQPGVEPRLGEEAAMIPAADMIHVGINWNPKVLRGVGVIAYARNSIAIGLSLDSFALSFFSQGALARTVLEAPGSPNPDQKRQLVESFNAGTVGLENANKTTLISGGLKLHTVSINPDDCQFLESRKFSPNEIARWFNLPPSKIGGERGSGTYANREQDAQEFVSHSIRPLCVALEKEFARKLILPSEQGKYFFQFDLNSLLRADIKTRYLVYQIGRQTGILSPNDCRRMENLPPRTDDGGDDYSPPIVSGPPTPPDDGNTDKPLPENKNDNANE